MRSHWPITRLYMHEPGLPTASMRGYDSRQRTIGSTKSVLCYAKKFVARMLAWPRSRLSASDIRAQSHNFNDSVLPRKRHRQRRCRAKIRYLRQRPAVLVRCVQGLVWSPGDHATLRRWPARQHCPGGEVHSEPEERMYAGHPRATSQRVVPCKHRCKLSLDQDTSLCSITGEGLRSGQCPR